MGRLTTHVLDIALGRPAAGLRIELYRLDPEKQRLKDGVTNRDGRLDEPLLGGEDFRAGVYEIVFHAGAYHATVPIDRPQPAFLDTVPIRIGIAEAGHYHVPLLLTPYGYSTYRGS